MLTRNLTVFALFFLVSTGVSTQLLSLRGDKPAEKLHDDFAGLDAAKWLVRKGQPSIDGWLVLTSASGKGAEAQSEQDFSFGSAEVKAASKNWHRDTSIGFEKWDDRGHSAVIVTGGHLRITKADRTADVPIPHWDSIKDRSNVFSLVWNSEQVRLEVKAHPECTTVYTGTLIPDTPLKVRLNASNAYADELRVDYVRVAAGTDRLLQDDFLKLDTARWWIAKGSPTIENWLVLASTAGQGAEVESREEFRFRTLKIRAASERWETDTSIGFEKLDGKVHYGVVVTNGKLGIVNQSKRGDNAYYKPIPNWKSISDHENVFTLTWKRERVEMTVKGHPECNVSYEGPLVPQVPLKVRLNASNDRQDRLSVDYVRVS